MKLSKKLWQTDKQFKGVPMNTKRVKFTFPENKITEPLIYQIGQRFEIITNIRRADVRDDMGWVILELQGDDNEIDEALKDYFGEYEVFSSEEMLYVPIENFNIYFKGFVDAVVKVGDTYHLFDWKTCSWGWDAKKKSDKIVTYQITLY